jgi:hypothetical protein
MMSPQKTRSFAAIARSAKAAAKQAQNPVDRNALEAIAGAAKLAQTNVDQVVAAKQALRAQTTSVLQAALHISLQHNRLQAAQWVRDELVARGVAPQA